MEDQETGKPQTTYPPIVRALVEKWRHRLIPNFEVLLWTRPLDLDTDPEGPLGSQAQSHTNARYSTIKLWLNLDHKARQADEFALEETIVHELLHALLEPLERAFDEVLHDSIAPHLLRLLKERQTDTLEQTVEKLARQLVDAERQLVGRPAREDVILVEVTDEEWSK